MLQESRWGQRTRIGLQERLSVRDYSRPTGRGGKKGQLEVDFLGGTSHKRCGNRWSSSLGLECCGVCFGRQTFDETGEWVVGWEATEKGTRESTRQRDTGPGATKG